MGDVGQNIVKNSQFAQGLVSWVGSHAKRVKDPLHEERFCIVLGNEKWMSSLKNVGVLKQLIQGPFQQEGRYMLRYQLMHAYLVKPAELYVDVSYWDEKGNRIRSIPTRIVPNHTTLRWHSYSIIVPSAPQNATTLSVSFRLRGGVMYLGYIELKHELSDENFKEDASFDELQEECTEEHEVTEDVVESIINYDAI